MKRPINWERLAIALISAAIPVITAYNASQREEICTDVQHLRADIIQVLGEARGSFSGADPDVSRQASEAFYREASEIIRSTDCG